VPEPMGMPTSGYGSGVNERHLLRMTPEEIEAFLADWHTLNCATLNEDGSVHLVAMWYGFLEGSPAFHTKAKSQKILNLRRDPRITCLIEEGDAYTELRGLEIVGRAEIINDPARMFEVGVSVFERSQKLPFTEERRLHIEAGLNKRLAVKVHVERFVSWDHRKLGV
jgi:nitroimidazol reductase NimA-like FMN-containing flavoprotein (pyridoxamine 5'-phosphate oxidase superfamily)